MSHQHISKKNRNARRAKKLRRRVCYTLFFMCAALWIFFAHPNETYDSDAANFAAPQPVMLSTQAIDFNIRQEALPNISSGYQSEQPPVSIDSVHPQQDLTDEETPKPSVLKDIQINSQNALLTDLESGNILLDINGSETMYPASMTKIMTAVIVLEYITDLNEKVRLSSSMFKTIYDENASVAGFLPGESVRVIDLLYGLLLPSGAECAVGLAEFVVGSESAFVSLMNDKAKELGMSGTNFTNATGLHDSNHYSTAMDMTVLLKYALENDTFYEIITSSRHSTPSTNRHDGGLTYYSTLFSKISSPAFNGGTILGGKTGFTDEAGQCLASLAEKDGIRYILVTCGAHGDKLNLHFNDAITVYNAIASAN